MEFFTWGKERERVERVVRVRGWVREGGLIGWVTWKRGGCDGGLICVSMT